MKKIIKLLPLIAGLLLLGYSFYAHYKISGFRIFDINTSTGLFYIRTYKYAAIAGIAIILIYAIIFAVTYKKKKSKKEIK